MTAPTCPFCNGAFLPERLLERVSSYSTATDSGCSSCPQCQKGLEFRVAHDSLEFGYTYWGGSLHFDSVHAFRIPGLRLVSSGSSLAAFLDDDPFPFPSALPPPGPGNSD